jgi:hypothetical protein
MLRHRFLFWLAALPLLAVQPLLAANVQVGTCKPRLKSFSNISDAVNYVKPGSTIEVCPGTYGEQVTITKPLTLQGVTAGSDNQILITVPAGFAANAVSVFGATVAAQVLVEGVGPVNITNIAVDGTGGNPSCAFWTAGIFYASGSSGTVNQVRASNQTGCSSGVGIWAENDGTSTQAAATEQGSVTIQNSSVDNVDSTGIFGGSSSATPTLSVRILDNVVNGSGTAIAGINPTNVNGQVWFNDVSNAVNGVLDVAPAATSVVLNTITATTFAGVSLQPLLGVSQNGGTAASNHVSGSNIGVLLGVPGAKVSGNRIVSSTAAGVEMGCFAASVSGNFINDAPVGIDAATGSIGSNTFANTATTMTNNGCAAAAAAVRAVRANSQQQWRTPATPFGTRTK